MINFLLFPLLAGIGLALLTGPLGSFVVWRRMAYFGDTLAHSALLGVALSLLLEVHPTIGICAVCAVIAFILNCSEKNQTISSDSMLGILSHSMLALGIVVMGFFSNTRIDLLGFLFGDILTVTSTELLLVYLLAVLGLLTIVIFWRPLIAMVVDEDVARVEGHNIERLKMILMFLLACVIGVAIKIVGVLLITALLIIPAAASHKLTRSPEAMAFFASLVGVVSVVVGLVSSMQFDTAAGPSIVICATLLYILIHLSVRINKPLFTLKSHN